MAVVLREKQTDFAYLHHVPIALCCRVVKEQYVGAITKDDQTKGEIVPSSSSCMEHL